MNWDNIIKLLKSNLDSELGLRLLLQMEVLEIQQFFVKYHTSSNHRHWDISRASIDTDLRDCYIHLNDEWLIFSTPAYVRLRKINIYDKVMGITTYTLKEYLDYVE